MESAAIAHLSHFQWGMQHNSWTHSAASDSSRGSRVPDVVLPPEFLNCQSQLLL
jgi:hypothetical protein